ncbi:hypothetical protein [Streptomyces chryseus]|uniref:hypothetical protein n=1 Tax=Streptomyces chryseus TaxID=68186 RepID=UPI00110FA1F1|nr:hypothetical protein [Streptomyces chryseus]GGW98373.1 hypothetical protein GCM10010353_12280 [Streptomyces chryseus]
MTFLPLVAVVLTGTAALAVSGNILLPARRAITLGGKIRHGCAGGAERTFSARCLGKVQDWNAEDGVLEVQSMAIFR